MVHTQAKHNILLYFLKLLFTTKYLMSNSSTKIFCANILCDSSILHTVFFFISTGVVTYTQFPICPWRSRPVLEADVSAAAGMPTCSQYGVPRCELHVDGVGVPAAAATPPAQGSPTAMPFLHMYTVIYV
eukprot:GEMP01061784.1.p1 GENE.GEMP01061784.1~~GEMP01061784.1.p1  ORF type:complete len:130 (-),score=8.24 GEMP01061784.1:107-496(-)